jgi:hypothetical protein
VQPFRCARNKKMNGVEQPGAIAPSDHVPGSEILHTEAKRVKFYGTKIINIKLTNRKKILHDVRYNKDIIEIERTEKERVTY